ncbi:MAG: FAD-binding oxidoreductase [Propionibacteriaceae bacterium]|jgi:decaprenylphospho-beta-D-ribofuranose 2-oxidase|nr:FAD-binding oxidoreductase [Propionibacteriaceae bacterium]
MEERGVFLSGWGRAAATPAHLVRPQSVEELVAAWPRLRQSARGVVTRGLGRSYGDVAQSGGGVVLDLTGLDRIGVVDPVLGEVEVEAGVSLDSLIRAVLPHGFWPAVLPGTRQVTVGGAIACDVHGKNHHSAGAFGQHVRWLDLLTADGQVRRLTPQGETADWFWATVAGLGLTGVILRAGLGLQAVETAYFLADGAKTDSWDETLAAHDEAAERLQPYSSAWFDAISPEPKLGRAAISRGRPAKLEELPPKLARHPLGFKARPLVELPDVFPNGLANKLTFSAVGDLWYAKAGSYQGRVQSLTGFYHPLDLIGDWNRAYGPKGFLQYQFVLPREATALLGELLRQIQASGHHSFLNVLKLFGPGDPAPLSYPVAGWNVCLDFPLKPGLATLLGRLDAQVLEAGGRLYAAKDSRAQAATFQAMYPRLDEWRAVKRQLDPDQVFVSDLARRLELL